jgi:hypothetical protein
MALRPYRKRSLTRLLGRRFGSRTVIDAWHYRDEHGASRIAIRARCDCGSPDVALSLNGVKRSGGCAHCSNPNRKFTNEDARAILRAQGPHRRNPSSNAFADAGSGPISPEV